MNWIPVYDRASFPYMECDRCGHRTLVGKQEPECLCDTCGWCRGTGLAAGGVKCPRCSGEGKRYEP